MMNNVCQHSSALRWNLVRAVLHYAETVSAQFCITLKLCPRSSALCWNHVHGVLHYPETVSQRSPALRWNPVQVILHYAETLSTQFCITLKPCPRSSALRWNPVPAVLHYAEAHFSNFAIENSKNLKQWSKTVSTYCISNLPDRVYFFWEKEDQHFV